MNMLDPINVVTMMIQEVVHVVVHSILLIFTWAWEHQHRQSDTSCIKSIRLGGA